ncbi:MAG TPA: hypothetical protein VI455_07935 [Terriglobia bacterium]
MSVAGISSSSFYQLNNLQNQQNNFQNIQSEFQLVGQDLSSGNLSQAQTDFATLTQNLPSSLQGSNSSPLAQAFSALGSDLQSGNPSAAQQDYGTLQQDVQKAGGRMHGHHHHHAGGASGSQDNEISQLFSTLGEDLQSGNLSAAQQAYASLQQGFQPSTSSTSSSSSTSTSSSVLSKVAGAVLSVLA